MIPAALFVSPPHMSEILNPTGAIEKIVENLEIRKYLVASLTEHESGGRPTPFTSIDQ